MIPLVPYITAVNRLAALISLLFWLYNRPWVVSSSRRIPGFLSVIIPISAYYDITFHALRKLGYMASYESLLSIYDSTFPVVCLFALFFGHDKRALMYTLLVAFSLSLPAYFGFPTGNYPGLYIMGSLSSLVLSVYVMGNWAKQPLLDLFMVLFFALILALGAASCYMDQSELVPVLRAEIRVIGLSLLLLLILVRVIYILRYAKPA